MRVLDLFSGVGGLALGLERAGMQTVAFCEIEPFCQKVLAKHWSDVPIFGDIRTLTREALVEKGVVHSGFGGAIDLVAGGFP
jgi:DNA (cytosine-5)-methyltransferase 1